MPIDSLITKNVAAATSGYSAPTEKVELSFPLITASSYTFQPRKYPTLSVDISANVIYRGSTGWLFGGHRVLQRLVPG